MSKKNNKRRLKEVGIPILFFVGILLVWEILVLLFNIPEYLLPKPTAIIFEIITNFSSLLLHTGITMFEAITGYLIAALLGFVMAVFFAHSKIIERGFYPFAIALTTTPIIALAPILILWFGTGLSSKIAITVLICFFPILVNTIKGLKSIDSDALDLFRSYSATKWQIFTKLRFFHALPYLFSALKISTSLAVVGAIVGEFVGSSEGIGYLILVSSYHLNTTTVFAAIVLSSLAGLLFFWVIALIESKVIFWEHKES